jgi:hypothetical protein
MRRFESTVMYLTWRRKREVEQGRAEAAPHSRNDAGSGNNSQSGENVQSEIENLNVISIYLGSLAPGSRRTMRQALAVIADILTSGTEAENVRQVRENLSSRYSPATANKMLSAVRGVLKASQQTGLMSAEDYQAAASISNVINSAPARQSRALPIGFRNDKI